MLTVHYKIFLSQYGTQLSVVYHTRYNPPLPQEYEIGNKFTEVEINGEEAIVNTEWEGTAISEHHKTDSFEYKMMRVLQDDDTMVLQLQSPKGTKAERIYKKVVE